jgi:predicted aldo/keto reductase-like oxidoreductase
MGLDIPTLLNLYNEEVFSAGGFLVTMQLASLPRDKRPAACIGCRKCESVCPQQIKIPDVLKKLCEITAKKA